MKITSEINKLVNTSNIEMGECFCYDAQLYMKIKNIGDAEESYNCVCLNTGEVKYVSNDVLRVTAECVIR